MKFAGGALAEATGLALGPAEHAGVPLWLNATRAFFIVGCYYTHSIPALNIRLHVVGLRYPICLINSIVRYLAYNTSHALYWLMSDPVSSRDVPADSSSAAAGICTGLIPRRIVKTLQHR